MTDQVNGTENNKSGPEDDAAEAKTKTGKVEVMEEVQEDAAKQRAENGGYQ